MTSPNEIRPVLIKVNGEQKPVLRYDPATGTVQMDPVAVRDFALGDFGRIHAFFRRIKGLKVEGRPGFEADARPRPVVFVDLEEGEVFRTSAYPRATLRRRGDGGEIVSGYVLLGDGRHTLEAGVVVVNKHSTVETLQWQEG